MLPIWTWECDLDGIYTACSPEIILCLGLAPEKALLQPISSFQVDEKTSVRLSEIIQTGKAPPEIDALFQSSQGDWVRVKINIFEQKNDQGVPIGWHGFNQIILSDNAPVEKTSESLGVITPQPDLSAEHRVTTDQGLIQPGSSFLTDLARESPGDEKLRFQNGKPAVIAAPFSFGVYGAGLIEIVDTSHERTWKDEELEFVEEVSLQLASTLERLLLQAVLNKEIQERTRAEEEILRRNQDLARLHQISQQLGKQTKPEEVYEFLYKTLGEMIDNRNLTIAIYNRNMEPGFPLVYRDGQRIGVEEDAFAASILKYVCREKSPLLITGARREGFETYQIIPVNPLPSSLIAVPMMAGDRAIGAIILQDFLGEKTYNFVHMELLTTIATQTTTILENVNLFQEIRNALKAIETRERYQAKIARSVATLSQSGSAAINTVFELIGQATECSRIAYIQLFEAGDENRWKTIKTWISPRYVPSSHHIVDYQFSIDSLKSEDNYPEKGWITGPLLSRAGGGPESAPLSIGTFLLLTVPGKNLWRTYISIEQLGSQRTWEIEEIDILKVAADALSNTIIREGLMEQLQISLNEL